MFGSCLAARNHDSHATHRTLFTPKHRCVSLSLALRLDRLAFGWILPTSNRPKSFSQRWSQFGKQTVFVASSSIGLPSKFKSHAVSKPRLVRPSLDPREFTRGGTSLAARTRVLATKLMPPPGKPVGGSRQAYRPPRVHSWGKQFGC
jgi:hypothetical protein